MTKRTYFIDHISGFSNQFTLAIATTEFDAENYIAKGYERITRKQAARMAAKNYISSIDQDYRSYEIDHGRYEPDYWSPSFAALCHTGGEIDPRDIRNVQYA